MAKSTKKTKESQEVVVNLESWGVPIAIVVSASIISGMIFFTSRNGGQTISPGSGTTDTTAEETFSEGTVKLGDDPYIGDMENAKVAIIEFADYQCSFCKRHSDETFPSIKTNYIDTGKVVYVFKEFPLSSAGDIGYTIAEGGVCLFDQTDGNTFADYHKRGYTLSSRQGIIDLAVELGANESEFTQCLDDGTFRAEIDADAAEGSSAGVTGTPGFIVGLIGDDGTVEGTLIAGAYPYETFADAIDALLEE